jgi:glutamine amidotransferase
LSEVVVVNSGVANLDSITRALSECGGRPVVSDDPIVVEKADRVVLPGVGSFATAMRNLNALGLAAAIRNLLNRRHVPFLGICLGMQLMATRGEEHGAAAGLDLIAGEVVPLQIKDPRERIPHMGWNEITARKASPLLGGLADGTDFYFVHSFHFRCADPADVLATVPGYGGVVAAIQRGNIMGTQFHPEKSQRAGFKLLQNFLKI